MAAKKRPGKKTEGGPPAKRPARGARLQDDPVWATTNPKSHMVSEDLHGQFANPKTYEKWTKEDWEEMRVTGLPEDAPYAEDGYSVPMEYFKYNSDWRRHVREFQEDLGAGRYEPEWQAAAAQAMEERANGKFDKFKEDAYEEFWGQKQKQDHHAVAGESANIKLDELIEHGVVRLGDFLSYKRVFGKGKGALLIEKDAEIVKVAGPVLTFAVPLGKRKYAHRVQTGVVGEESPAKVKQNGNHETEPESSENQAKETTALEEKTTGEEKTETNENATNGHVSADDTEPHQPPKDTSLSHRARQYTPESPASSSKPEYQTPEAPPFSPLTIPSISTNPTPLKLPQDASISNTPSKIQPDKDPSNTPSKPNPATNSSISPATSSEGVTLTSITSLNQLEVAMIAADGRFKGEKDPRIVNSWRSMRGIRNNQDLGTLWEMREEYYVYQHPKIVKMPKRQDSMSTTTPTPTKKRMSRAERYAAREGHDGATDEL